MNDSSKHFLFLSNNLISLEERLKPMLEYLLLLELHAVITI